MSDSKPADTAPVATDPTCELSRDAKGTGTTDWGCERDDEGCTARIVPERVHTEPDGISALGAFEGELYWATMTAGVIRKLTADGTVENVTPADGATGRESRLIRSITFYDGRIYWVMSPVDRESTSMIGSMSLTRGDMAEYEVVGDIFDIAVGGTSLYLTDFDRGLMHTSVGLEGARPIEPSRLAGWVNASGVAVSGGDLFWSQLNLDNSIRYLRIEGLPGGHGLVACDQRWPQALEADPERVFWIDQNFSENVGRILTKGLVQETAQVVVSGRPFSGAQTLALDSSHLYWVESGEDIMRLPK